MTRKKFLQFLCLKRSIQKQLDLNNLYKKLPDSDHLHPYTKVRFYVLHAIDDTNLSEINLSYSVQYYIIFIPRSSHYFLGNFERKHEDDRTGSATQTRLQVAPLQTKSVWEFDL